MNSSRSRYVDALNNHMVSDFEQTLIRSIPRSEEANDMLGRVPNWMLRWGILSILTTLIIGLGIAAFVRYPDKLEGTAFVTAIPRPAKCYATTSGAIKDILVHDHSSVVPGTPLVELQNPIGYGTISNLSKLAETVQTILNKHEFDKLVNIQHRDYPQSADIQRLYNQLMMRIAEYEAANTEKNRNIGVWRMAAALGEIHGYIENWKNQYLITAPIGGCVQFLRSMENGNSVSSNENLVVINPPNEHYIAVANFPYAVYPTLFAGQQARLSLRHLPTEQYGYLEGRVSTVSARQYKEESSPSMPGTVENIESEVIIQLPDTLVSTLEKPIRFFVDMPAQVQIATPKRSVLQRLIGRFVGSGIK